MRFTRGSLLFAFALLVTASGAAHAETDTVGIVGVRSAEIPTAELAPMEASLDRAVSVNAASARAKSSTLQALAFDNEIAGWRADARRSLEAGRNGIKTFQLEIAQTELDKALALYTSAQGAYLDPSEFGRIYFARARLAQVTRQPKILREELAHAVLFSETKQLDPHEWPPDVVQTFKEVIETAAAEPPHPGSAAALSDLAKRVGLRWVVYCEAHRRGTGAHVIALTVVESSGTGKTETVEIPAGANLDAAFELAVAKLFASAGVTTRSATAVAAGPTPASSPSMSLLDVLGNPTASGGTTGGGSSTATTGASSTGSAATSGGTTGTSTTASTGSSATTGGTQTHPVPAVAVRTPVPRATPRPGEPREWYEQWYTWAGAAGALGAGAIVYTSTQKSGGGGGGGPSGITLVITK